MVNAMKKQRNVFLRWLNILSVAQSAAPALWMKDQPRLLAINQETDEDVL